MPNSLQTRAFAHRNEEDRALSMSMGRKKIRHVVIEKRETSGSEMQRVGCEVHLSTEYSSLELDSTISAVTESIEHRIESREEENIGGRIAGKILLQAEVTSIIAKCTLFQAL